MFALVDGRIPLLYRGFALVPLAGLVQLRQPVATGMATKDARRDAALRAVSILVDLATTTDLRPAEARALTAALTALGELRVQRAAARRARAGQQLVNDLASVYAAVAEEARVAEKRLAGAKKRASRSPAARKSALRFGRTEGAEARLGRTVFEAVSDAIGDWARDTGDLNHEATTQWALEELELDAAEIKKLKGPRNAAATVVGRSVSCFTQRPSTVNARASSRCEIPRRRPTWSA